MAHRKVYTPEFKQQVVQLAQQLGNTNQGIASDLGISQSALSSWIKAAKEHGSLAFLEHLSQNHSRVGVPEPAENVTT